MRSGRYLISFRDALEIIKDNEPVILCRRSGIAIIEMEHFDFLNHQKIKYISISAYQKPDLYIYPI